VGFNLLQSGTNVIVNGGYFTQYCTRSLTVQCWFVDL